jgi:RND family efflux transporter MFP subunit
MCHVTGSVLIQRVTAVALALTAIACGSSAESTGESPAPSIVQVAPENVVTAELREIVSGPMISGELTPAREAKVRTQVGGSIVSLTVDRGQPVAAGAEVAKISSRDLEAAFASTESAVKSAEIALDVAKAEEQRTTALVSGGALAARDLEQARNAVSNADAQLAAARARQRSVWQQIDDITIRSPLTGIVSERPASAGDVVAPGAELFTVIDLSSLRLEALVPSNSIQEVRPGTEVRFTIRGAAGDFVGTVDRLSPVADPVTRQVAIFVSIPNAGRRLIAGLFAEGRVISATRRGIVVPIAAVDETGAVPTVTRIRDGKAERVPVTLGLRQGEVERVEVVTGIGAGDVLLVGSSKGVAPGTPIKVVG